MCICICCALGRSRRAFGSFSYVGVVCVGSCLWGRLPLGFMLGFGLAVEGSKPSVGLRWCANKSNSENRLSCRSSSQNHFNLVPSDSLHGGGRSGGTGNGGSP